MMCTQVIWQITANHGGGYQYRLCPAGQVYLTLKVLAIGQILTYISSLVLALIAQPLTEDCFQKHPLQFDRSRQVGKSDVGSGGVQLSL